jgi:hypothetical protein
MTGMESSAPWMNVIEPMAEKQISDQLDSTGPDQDFCPVGRCQYKVLGREPKSSKESKHPAAAHRRVSGVVIG